MAKKAKINWISIMGHAEVKGSSITYTPVQIIEGPNKGQTQVCMLKCDRWFESGKISFKVSLSGEGGSAQVIFNHDTPANQVFTGVGAGGEFGIQLWSIAKSRLEPLTSINPGAKPKSGVYNISIEVKGSKTTLFVDNVSVCTANCFIRKAQPCLFIGGDAKAVVSDFAIDGGQSKAFVVMQFTSDFNELYDEVIKPTVESFGIECMRADDFHTSGLILIDIAQSILESQLIIADITPDNPNVFYEVGFAHGMGKPLILLSEKSREKLPFDVSGFRTLFYDNSIGGKRKVEERLTKFITNILES
ncbi:MAG: hypothetical protein WBC05_10505 [Sedimentisphaerales bacterium]